MASRVSASMDKNLILTHCYMLTTTKALSQRAHFFPTLSLSLSRARFRANSATLRAKLAALRSPLPRHGEDGLCLDSADLFGVNNSSPSVAARLWIHTQKDLLSRVSVGQLQPFCASRTQTSSALDLDEILEEYQARGEVHPAGVSPNELPNPDGLGSLYDDELFDEPATGVSGHSSILSARDSCRNTDSLSAPLDHDDDLLFPSNGPAPNPGKTLITRRLPMNSEAEGTSHRCFAHKRLNIDYRYHSPAEQKQRNGSPDNEMLFSPIDPDDDMLLEGDSRCGIGNENNGGLDVGSIEQSTATRILVSAS